MFNSSKSNLALTLYDFPPEKELCFILVRKMTEVRCVSTVCLHCVCIYLHPVSSISQYFIPSQNQIKAWVVSVGPRVRIWACRLH